MMRKWRHLWIDLYQVNVYFINCHRHYYKQKILSEFGDCLPPISKNTTGRFEVHEKDGQDICVIWITSWEDLSHEIFHCACWIMTQKGVWLTEASEEAYAYLIGYLDRKLRNM